MSKFFICTATRDKDYFFIPAPDADLKKREQVWRSPYDETLIFSLVSHRGEVTFSAGPLKSGRYDRQGRRIVNSLIVRSSAPEDKLRMGQVFSSMLAGQNAQNEFAELVETQIVQSVLNGGTWNGELPEIKADELSASFDAVTQQVYPMDSRDAQECAAKIPALIKSGQDFAVGCCSELSSDTVAMRLCQEFNFNWKNTFIALFSSGKTSKSPLQCPPGHLNIKKRASMRRLLFGIIAAVLLAVTLATCSKSKKAVQPSAPTLQKVGEKK